jgi:hypothetical protein
MKKIIAEKVVLTDLDANRNLLSEKNNFMIGNGFSVKPLPWETKEFGEVVSRKDQRSLPLELAAFLLLVSI